MLDVHGHLGCERDEREVERKRAYCEACWMPVKWWKVAGLGITRHVDDIIRHGCRALPTLRRNTSCVYTINGNQYREGGNDCDGKLLMTSVE